MAHIVEDNVRESATTTGLGSFSLGGALTTGRTFASVCADADTVHYSIHHATLNEWEVGLGTYETTGNLLLRTTPLESSNAGAAVNFSAGDKRVELVLPGDVVRTIYTLRGLTGVVRVDAGVPSADTDVTDIVAAATDTAAGKVELATTAEQLAGTDAVRACTPDSVAALWEAGADNAGGATITLGDGYAFNLITSTTTITAFAFTTDKAGRCALIRFATSRQVTHNATSLISPTGANLLFAAGDQMVIQSLGSGNFRIVNIRKFDAATGEGLGGVTAITANAAATNATTNLSVTGSYTAVANVNRVMSVWRAMGYFVFVHTAAATPTLTLEVVVNGAVVDSAIMTPESVAATYSGRVYALVTIRTIGAGGTMMANCWFESDGQLPTGATSVSGSVSTATDAIDTTVARTLELRVRMTTAVASNTLTVTQGFWEKVV